MKANPSPHDWTRSLTKDDVEWLRGRPFERLARIPPPKRDGLVLGHELRILGRYLSGGSSSLDPSGFAGGYRSLLSPSERLLHAALVEREPLLEGLWAELLGDSWTDWKERGLLVEDQGSLRCAFRVVPHGNSLYAVDPPEKAFAGKIHIGQDSLNLLEFVARRAGRDRTSILDVGTGSGFLLLGLAPRSARGVGVEINPRAVRAARVNVALNGSNSSVIEGDVFDPALALDRFDLVLWNAPFMFFPESERERNLDGYGGDLGIEITLDFVERLPGLLLPGGCAFVLTSAPILAGGENRLAAELEARVQRLQLDITAHPRQLFWVPGLAEFHESRGIERFESTILELRPGTGRFSQRARPAGQRFSNVARGVLYRLQRLRRAS